MKKNIGSFLKALRDAIAKDYNYSFAVIEHTIMVYIGECDDLCVEYDADEDKFAPLYIDDSVANQGLGLGDAEAIVSIYHIMQEYKEILQNFVKGGNENE